MILEVRFTNYNYETINKSHINNCRKRVLLEP